MKSTPQSGFTLLELLVVLAILALIAGFAGPQIFKHLAGARTDSAKIQIENLSTAIDLYKLDLTRYPPDLEALVSAPTGVDDWSGPYLRKGKVPKDPWGNDYEYTIPGDHGEYDLMSYGADAAQGGNGEDADVLGWE